VAHPRSADLFLADLADEIDEHPQWWSAVANGRHTYWPVEDGRLGDGSPSGSPHPISTAPTPHCGRHGPAELPPLPGSRIAEIVIADPHDHRWSPPWPPPTGRRVTCSPPPPNTCVTSPRPNNYAPTNTRDC
jgi:hypothetical protein